MTIEFSRVLCRDYRLVPLPLMGPSCVNNRKPSPTELCYDGGEGRMPRSPSDHGPDHCFGSPHCYHGNGEEMLPGCRRPIRDRRGRWHSQVGRTSQVGFILFSSYNIFWCCTISKLFFIFVWMVSQSFLSKPFPTYLRKKQNEYFISVSALQMTNL